VTLYDLMKNLLILEEDQGDRLRLQPKPRTGEPRGQLPVEGSLSFLDSIGDALRAREPRQNCLVSRDVDSGGGGHG
jgi:hypothetical protein